MRSILLSVPSKTGCHVTLGFWRFASHLYLLYSTPHMDTSIHTLSFHFVQYSFFLDFPYSFPYLSIPSPLNPLQCHIIYTAVLRPHSRVIPPLNARRLFLTHTYLLPPGTKVLALSLVVLCTFFIHGISSPLLPTLLRHLLQCQNWINISLNEGRKEGMIKLLPFLVVKCNLQISSVNNWGVFPWRINLQWERK